MSYKLTPQQAHGLITRTIAPPEVLNAQSPLFEGEAYLVKAIGGAVVATLVTGTTTLASHSLASGEELAAPWSSVTWESGAGSLLVYPIPTA